MILNQITNHDSPFSYSGRCLGTSSHRWPVGAGHDVSFEVGHDDRYGAGHNVCTVAGLSKVAFSGVFDTDHVLDDLHPKSWTQIEGK